MARFKTVPLKDVLHDLALFLNAVLGVFVQIISFQSILAYILPEF